MPSLCKGEVKPRMFSDEKVPIWSWPSSWCLLNRGFNLFIITRSDYADGAPCFPFGKNAKTIKNRHTNKCAAWHASDIMLSCCLHVCDGCCSLITSAWTQIHIWRVFVCYSIKRPSSQFVTAPLKRNSDNLWMFFLILGCFSWLTGVFTGYWQESSASTAE